MDSNKELELAFALALQQRNQALDQVLNTTLHLELSIRKIKELEEQIKELQKAK